MLAAIWHSDGASANAAVKFLHQAFLRANVQIGQAVAHFVGQAGSLHRELVGYLVQIRRFNGGGRLLGRAVGVQKLAGEVDDSIAAPGHPHARFSRYFGHAHGLQIFRQRFCQKLLLMFSGNNHRHTLLRFGNG